MTHITLSGRTVAKPSLEFYSDGSNEPRRVAIEQCPFKIGRAEATDLRIDSAQVSRVHAEIVNRGGVWFLRDLGSTNGTRVNGKAVAEAMLADGDLIKIAETELTFVAASATNFQRMVTQPIHGRERTATPALTLPVDVAAARAVTEAILVQAIPVRLLSLTSLAGGGDEATFAMVDTVEGPADVSPQFRSSHRVGARYRDLFRRNAAEQAVHRGTATKLFVAVDAIELEYPNHLLVSLETLQEQLPVEWELGAIISAAAVLETVRVGEFYQAARKQGLLLAYNEFQGNGGQVTQLDKVTPDFIVLSDSMTKGIATTADARQPLRRLESIVAACEDLMVTPVLLPCDCQPATEICRQLGFRWGLQPLAPEDADAALQTALN